MTKDMRSGPWFEIALVDQDDELHRFSDYLGGKVLLSFLPKSTSPCFNGQAQLLHQASQRLQLEGGVVLGVADEPPHKLRSAYERENLSFILLSDMEHQLASCLGVWREKELLGKRFLGVQKSSHLFDEAGAWIESCEDPNPPSQAEWWSRLLGWQKPPSAEGRPA